MISIDVSCFDYLTLEFAGIDPLIGGGGNI